MARCARATVELAPRMPFSPPACSAVSEAHSCAAPPAVAAVRCCAGQSSVLRWVVGLVLLMMTAPLRVLPVLSTAFGRLARTAGRGRYSDVVAEVVAAQVAVSQDSFARAVLRAPSWRHHCPEPPRRTSVGHFALCVSCLPNVLRARGGASHPRRWR